MISVNGEEYLTVKEATRLLGVKPATLYAYVSRGVLRSYRQGIKRQRLYRRAGGAGGPPPGPPAAPPPHRLPPPRPAPPARSRPAPARGPARRWRRPPAGPPPPRAPPRRR